MIASSPFCSSKISLVRRHIENAHAWKGALSRTATVRSSLFGVVKFENFEHSPYTRPSKMGITVESNTLRAPSIASLGASVSLRSRMRERIERMTIKVVDLAILCSMESNGIFISMRRIRALTFARRKTNLLILVISTSDDALESVLYEYPGRREKYILYFQQFIPQESRKIGALFFDHVIIKQDSSCIGDA